MALTNIESIETIVSSNLTKTLQPSSESVSSEDSQTVGTEDLASTMFADDDSMDFLMNKIGLEVQRNGGE